MAVGARNFQNVRPLHRLPNLLHTQSINLLFGGRLKDINSGLRAIKLDKLVDLDAGGFDIEAQISARALKRGMRIKEIPIEYRRRLGDSKIRISDGAFILWRILKERFKS